MFLSLLASRGVDSLNFFSKQKFDSLNNYDPSFRHYRFRPARQVKAGLLVIDCYRHGHFVPLTNAEKWWQPELSTLMG